MRKLCIVLTALVLAGASTGVAREGMRRLDAPKPPVFAEVPHMGIYEGSFKLDETTPPVPARATVVPIGQDTYRINILAEPVEDGFEGLGLEARGVLSGHGVNVFGWSAGYAWSGSIQGNTLGLGVGYDTLIEMERVSYESPTLGMAPPAGAHVLLPFEPGEAPDTSAWTNDKWVAHEDGSLEVVPRAGGNKTRQEFGDLRLHLEFKLGLLADELGQKRTNSGVFFNDAYEIQILDSFGVHSTNGDCGAIYHLTRPLVNASLPPGQWQTYDIEFRAPRLDRRGEVTERPRITVRHNGVLIHDDVEIAFPTRNNRDPHSARGPLALQDHGNRLFFRNIWVVEP